MLEIKGKYNSAKVFTDNIEEEAVAQIMHLLNQKFIEGSKIRIMPDVHSGAGCTIGTTMTITDKVVPNLVGVDIGCGMETVILKDTHVELTKLDKVIHQNIPSGFDIREKAHAYTKKIDLEQLRCIKYVNINRATLSLGTLGGGNHFIELDKDSNGKLILVIHSGSRNLGKQVAEYYQKTAYRFLNEKSVNIKALVEKLKSEGRDSEIETEIQKLKDEHYDKALAYTEGTLFEDYMHDIEIVQKYADLNRKAMVDVIVKEMKWKVEEQFTTIHNYIEVNTMILRKGAISAKAGEKVLIPMNMRDGSLICIGKGNEDWNYSAPHGAGRLMSRSKAKQSITLTEFEKTMEGIFSTTINRSTIDEAPFAYKPMEEIMKNVQETVEIIENIKPIYNFKAAE